MENFLVKFIENLYDNDLLYKYNYADLTDIIAQSYYYTCDDENADYENVKVIMGDILMKYATQNIKQINLKQNYFNPETGYYGDVRVIRNVQDLVCHQYDITKEEFQKNADYQRRHNQVTKINQLPQLEQKSKEWLQQRNQCITATAIAVVFDEDSYKHPIDTLLDKCGMGADFVENENVYHGKKYEEIANMFYGFRNNIQVKEYGLLIDEKYPFIGASPDGICFHSESSLVGRMLEIKCPKSRKIKLKGELDGDICPHYYYVQVQTQLMVAQLDECDFLQCEIHEYPSEKEYLEDSLEGFNGISKASSLEKGIVIELSPKNKVNDNDKDMCKFMSRHIYPPALHAPDNWTHDALKNFHQHPLSQDYVFSRFIYWRFNRVSCHKIVFDPDVIQKRIPLLKQFWSYVEYYRKHKDKLAEIKEYADKIEHDKSAEIFEKVHHNYLVDNPNTKYVPLYQEKNKWRIMADKKKSFMKRKFN